MCEIVGRVAAGGRKVSGKLAAYCCQVGNRGMKTILIINAGIVSVFVYGFIGALVFAAFETLRGNKWKAEWREDPEWATIVLMFWPAILVLGLVALPFWLVWALVDRIVRKGGNG